MRLSNSPPSLRFGEASQRSAARILCGAGSAVVLYRRPERTEVARDAKGPSDPRTSTPRDIEACRSPIVPQVRRRNGVPRAVFEGLLRIAPGGQTFYPPLEGFFGAGGTYSPFGKSRPCGRRIAQVAACRATGTSAAWTAGGLLAPHLRRPTLATAPRPASGDADQTPLGHEGGMT